MKEKNINEIYTFDRDYEAFPDIICLPPIPDEFKKKWGEKKKPFYATGKTTTWLQHITKVTQGWIVKRISFLSLNYRDFTTLS